MISIGTVKQYCCQDLSLIENYNKAINDKSQTWDCHHRLEVDENKSAKQLIDEGRYFNRLASELIFLTKAEHRSIHMEGEKHPMYGKNIKDYMTEEAYNQWYQTRLGENNPNFGKSPSEETRKKISEAMKGCHRVYENEEHTKWHMEKNI